MSRWKGLLILLAAAIIFITAGTMSHRDAVDAHSLYCERVFGDDPIWPDYDEVGKESCEDSL